MLSLEVYGNQTFGLNTVRILKLFAYYLLSRTSTNSHLAIQMNVIKGAQGSAYVEAGRTKLFCSVHGPRASGPRTASKGYTQSDGNINCEINFAPFSHAKRAAHQPEAVEQDLALCLLQAVAPVIRRDKIPSSHLDIYITILERDGGELAASITAAGAALVAAGVEMIDSVVGCSLIGVKGSVIGASDEEILLIDPDLAELISCREATRLTVALLPNLGQLSQLYLTGRPVDTTSGLQEALSMATDAARFLYTQVVQLVL